MRTPDLPYFDRLFEGRLTGEPVALAFEQHVHWGYWDPETPVEYTVESYREAAARLDAIVVAAAGLGDRQAHLDVGCGFGGTLKAIDERHRDMRLVGLNIDLRQIAAARTQVAPSPDNSLEFIKADACALPFADSSFDAVTAVECIFHFPSRLEFLKEAARVLKPGGRLSLSDFVPRSLGVARMALGGWLEGKIAKGYGRIGRWPDGDYRQMAKRAGLEMTLNHNITAQTMPTYAMLERFFRDAGVKTPQADAWTASTRWLRWLSHRRLVRYRVLAFRNSGVDADPCVEVDDA